MRILALGTFFGIFLLLNSAATAQTASFDSAVGVSVPRMSFPRIEPSSFKGLCNSKNCTKPDSPVIHIDSDGNLWSQPVRRLEDHPLEALRNDPRFEGEISEVDIEELILSVQDGVIRLTPDAKNAIGLELEARGQ